MTESIIYSISLPVGIGGNLKYVFPESSTLFFLNQTFSFLVTALLFGVNCIGTRVFESAGDVRLVFVPEIYADMKKPHISIDVAIIFFRICKRSL